MNENIMDKHYARLVELSRVKDGWNFGKGEVPNKQVFLDAMYVVGLCYIHNIKIKAIFLNDKRLTVDFDREDGLYFALINNGEYTKFWYQENPLDGYYLVDFKREDLKDILLGEFKPTSTKNSGPLP
jgi:hypothetical protein